jgi:hypothetical protein
MINKKELKGKHVAYYDSDGKQRIGKVRKIVGNYLTVVNATGKRRRVYRDKVSGRQLKNKVEEIQW